MFKYVGKSISLSFFMDFWIPARETGISKPHWFYVSPLSVSCFQPRLKRKYRALSLARLATKLQRTHYTEVKHDTIFELRRRCLIASCRYRLALSKYSEASRKQGPSALGYGKITRVDYSKTRESSQSFTRSLLVFTSRISLRICDYSQSRISETRSFECRFDESCLLFYALPRDLTRHKSTDSVMAHRVPPRFFRTVPRIWSILRSQVSCDLTSGLKRYSHQTLRAFTFCW